MNPRNCAVCGVEFIPQAGNHLMCSHDCRRQRDRDRTHIAARPSEPPPPLQPGSNPQPFDLSGAWFRSYERGQHLSKEEIMGAVRRVWCARYEGCLDYAAACQWSSWHCIACKVHERSIPLHVRQPSAKDGNV